MQSGPTGLPPEKLENWIALAIFVRLGWNLVSQNHDRGIEKFSDAPTNILQNSQTNPKVAYRENLKIQKTFLLKSGETW